MRLALFFLLLFPTSVSTGHTEDGVSQSPRHLVTQRGQNVTLRCDPISGHSNLYWYRQMQGQGLELLVYFLNERPSNTSGMPQERFFAKRPEGSHSELKIQPAERGDSATYLCASSPTTVWHSHPLPARKPPASLSWQLLEALRGPPSSAFPAPKELWPSAALWVERGPRLTLKCGGCRGRGRKHFCLLQV